MQRFDLAAAVAAALALGAAALALGAGASASAQETTLRLGHLANEENVWHKASLKFGEELSALTEAGSWSRSIRTRASGARST